jgi:hypothetical protein
MVRRIFAVLVGLLMVSMLYMGTAGAQQSPGPEVLPAEITQPAPAVRGDVVRQPLPRTGNDLDGVALFGAALTVAGVTLAAGARQRRNRLQTA